MMIATATVFLTFKIMDSKGVFQSKIGFLNPRESENGFCVSLLKRPIQDLSDHDASKEPKNPFPEWILWFLQEVDSSVPLTHHDQGKLGLICLVTKNQDGRRRGNLPILCKFTRLYVRDKVLSKKRDRSLLIISDLWPQLRNRIEDFSIQSSHAKTAGITLPS